SRPGRDRRASRSHGGSRGGPPTLLRGLREPAGRGHRRGDRVRAFGAAAHGRKLHGDRAHRPVLWRLGLSSPRSGIVQDSSRSVMTVSNLAAILDPRAADDRDFIIQLSPDADEELRITWGEARARIA